MIRGSVSSTGKRRLENRTTDIHIALVKFNLEDKASPIAIFTSTAFICRGVSPTVDPSLK